MRHSNGGAKAMLIISILCTIFGALFFGAGLIFKLIPISEASFNFTVNGVQQPYTPENVAFFRNLFFGIFGGIGGVLLVIGIGLGLVLFLAVRSLRRP